MKTKKRTPKNGRKNITAKERQENTTNCEKQPGKRAWVSGFQFRFRRGVPNKIFGTFLLGSLFNGKRLDDLLNPGQNIGRKTLSFFPIHFIPVLIIPSPVGGKGLGWPILPLASKEVLFAKNLTCMGTTLPPPPLPT